MLVREGRHRILVVVQLCDQHVEAEVAHVRADDHVLVLQVQIDYLVRLTVTGCGRVLLLFANAGDLLFLAETVVLSGHDAGSVFDEVNLKMIFSKYKLIIVTIGESRVIV